MSWATVAALHTTTPVVLVSIAWNSGTRYYSTDYVRTATRIYKGNITSLPQITTSAGDIKRTYERGVITLVFNDSDYEFRGLEFTESPGFKNRIVTISIAFQDDAYATTQTVYTGYIYDWKRTENLTYELSVAELSKNLENTYPERLITFSDYPNAESGSIGITVPAPYGTISAIGLSNDGAYGHPSLSGSYYMPFIDTTVDAEKHLVGEAELGTTITVNRLYKNSIPQTAGVHYNVTTAAVDGYTRTMIAWIAGARPTKDDKISADIVNGSRRPVEAIKHYLITFCGYVDGDFDSVCYASAMATELSRGYDFSGVFWEAKTLRSTLDDLREEFALDIYWDKDGLICFKYLTSILPATSAYTDFLHIMDGHESDPQVDKLINYIRYGFNFNHARAYFYNYGLAEDTASQTKYGAIFRTDLSLRFVRDSATALDLAIRKIIRFRNPVTFDKFLFPLFAFSDDLADVTSITHFNGKGVAGYVNNKFQIRRQIFNLDAFYVETMQEDISAFAGTAMILGDRTKIAATWVTASEADRYYAYAGDRSTGKFSDGSPAKQLFD